MIAFTNGFVLDSHQATAYTVGFGNELAAVELGGTV